MEIWAENLSIIFSRENCHSKTSDKELCPPSSEYDDEYVSSLNFGFDDELPQPIWISWLKPQWLMRCFLCALSVSFTFVVELLFYVFQSIGRRKAPIAQPALSRSCLKFECPQTRGPNRRWQATNWTRVRVLIDRTVLLFLVSVEGDRNLLCFIDCNFFRNVRSSVDKRLKWIIMRDAKDQMIHERQRREGREYFFSSPSS